RSGDSRHTSRHAAVNDPTKSAVVADLSGFFFCPFIAKALISFPGSIFTRTTGATASNLLGMALGREFVVARNSPDYEPWRFDMDALAQHLSRGTPCVILVGAGEVSAGRFGTAGEEMTKIRTLANQYGAWVHDGAFGLQALIFPHTEAYRALNEGVSGLHLADSITGDAHKLLNLQQAVFRNPGSAYLSTIALSIPRRFRALPVYASLLAHGRIWHCNLFEQHGLYIRDSNIYELLPNNDVDKIYMVVLFRARSEALNVQLVSLINASRHLHISGLPWNGKPATRIAMGTWRVGVDRDFGRIIKALEAASLHHPATY
ncbi:pyridoxal phosphate-dependent transferase, partial [Mycena leptocephala]